MSAYIDASYVDAFVGTAVRQKLFDDGGGYVSAFFDTMVGAASAAVDSALAQAGYPTPVTSATPEAYAIVRLATFGQWVVMAYARKGLDVEAISKRFVDQVSLLELIRDGEVPLPGLDPATGDGSSVGGVGGFSFTPSDETTGDEDARAQVFNRSTLRGY